MKRKIWLLALIWCQGVWQCSEYLCGHEDQKQQATVFLLCVALSLHHEVERIQRCTAGKDAAWECYDVSLVHACPKLNEGTGSAAEHWAEVVVWTARRQ